MVGVDTNADHFAAYRLDRHGNPVGEPHRFGYDLSGTTSHRDAQIRHALTRLINWARCVGVAAIGIEDLDFATERTREKHGRRKRFRQLISGMPTGKLKARLVSMAAEHGLSVVAVDPAYTSLWGAQHWQKPLTTPRRKMSRHDAAGIAIGRRALGHPVRRRTAPPPHDRSDRAGHRTAQAAPGTRGREGTRPPTTDRPPGGPPPNGKRKREPSASKTVRDAPSTHQWVHDLLTHAGHERCPTRPRPQIPRSPVSGPRCSAPRAESGTPPGDRPAREWPASPPKRSCLRLSSADSIRRSCSSRHAVFKSLPSIVLIFAISAGSGLRPLPGSGPGESSPRTGSFGPLRSSTTGPAAPRAHALRRTAEP
ncbi:IS200/IS605 family accessory protein TnpB-related protein [Streptomyces sp. NPDC005078]|uniref:IS200/IS605 family accessory protein TnpB-related protein n=1 Tax=unclassified Streptomyces TaxID=2593676 RepID=UPI00339F9CA8